jgi:nitrogen-specific signal transduction histidine kinase
MERLTLVLRTIRDVGRLLINENDPGKLIHGICHILVKKRGYYNAWIGLFGQDNTIDLIANSKIESAFETIKTNIERQIFPPCIEHTIRSETVFAAKDPLTACISCPLSKNYANRSALAVCLAYRGKNYGFMVVSIPRELASDDNEKNVLKEISDDIAVALYRIDLEEKRKLTEEGLRQSKIQFKTLIENSLTSISIIQNHNIVYNNPGLGKVHEMIRRVLKPPEFSAVYVEDRSRIKQLYGQLLSNDISQIKTDFRYCPLKNNTADKKIRWALLRANKIDYLGIESVLTNTLDITDSKEVENFLRIQDKMTSLGRVTAGIAHEIRNPLSGIYIYLKALKKICNQTGDHSKVVSIIDKIEAASNKIESIIKRVMDFSKPSHPQFSMTNLNQYIEDATKLTSVTLKKKGIQFEKYLDPHLPNYFAEPHLIEQVILNLINNAAEAMKNLSGEKSIVLKTIKQDYKIIISVKDTGPGIPLSRQSKIFDPFYTTKSNSSGIGLSICHRIILDHGGSLKLDSAENKGATFTIELPLTGRKEEGKPS